MTDNKQHDTRTTRRPDCVTEIRMGNSGTGSGSCCYTGADLSGVDRSMGKAATLPSVAACIHI